MLFYKLLISKFKMLFIILLSLISICSSNIVLKPTAKDGLEAGLIFVQGAQIDSANYQTFALQLQSKFPGKLWVSIPEFPLIRIIGKIGTK